MDGAVEQLQTCGPTTRLPIDFLENVRLQTNSVHVREQLLGLGEAETEILGTKFVHLAHGSEFALAPLEASIARKSQNAATEERRAGASE